MRLPAPLRPARARRGACLLLALLLGGLALLPLGAGAAQAEKRYYWARYDVDLTLNADGSLNGMDTQVFQYTSGLFRGAFRYWETARLEDITNISVADESGPYTLYNGDYNLQNGPLPPPQTFVIERSNGRLSVYWFHPPTPAPATRQITLRYHILGGVRVYSGGDQIWWTTVPPDRAARIDASTTTVHLLPGTDMDKVQGASIPDGLATVTTGAGQLLKASTIRSLAPNETMDVRVQWPHGLLAGGPPAWQQRDDTERQQQEAERVRQEEEARQRAAAQQQAEQEQMRQDAAARRQQQGIDFFLLVASGLLAVGGVVFWLLRWYTGGRDKPVGLTADYLPEPPDSLPPGLVGTLLDEHADPRDVMGTVLDLARKGHMLIRPLPPSAWGTDYEYVFQNANTTYPYEKLVLGAVFDGAARVRLGEIRARLAGVLPPIYDAMYGALVDLQYFERNPEQTRHRYRWLALGMIALAVVAFIIGMVVSVRPSPWVLGPPFALLAVGGLGVWLAEAMPRKTLRGSEQAAHWRAFRNYLANLQGYTGVQAAAGRYEEYLPYAVALDVDRALQTQFEEQNVRVPIPAWYIPLGAAWPASGGAGDGAAQGTSGSGLNRGGLLSSGAPDHASRPPGGSDWSSGAGGLGSTPGGGIGQLAGGEPPSGLVVPGFGGGSSFGASGNSYNGIEGVNRSLGGAAESASLGLGDMVQAAFDLFGSSSRGSSDDDSGSSSSSGSGSSWGSSDSSSHSSSSSSGSSWSGGGSSSSSSSSGGGGGGGAF